MTDTRDAPVRDQYEMMLELGKLYRDIQHDRVELKAAAEMNNTAGKFLKAAQLELVRSQLQGEIDRMTASLEDRRLGINR